MEQHDDDLNDHYLSNDNIIDRRDILISSKRQQNNNHHNATFFSQLIVICSLASVPVIILLLYESIERINYKDNVIQYNELLWTQCFVIMSSFFGPFYYYYLGHKPMLFLSCFGYTVYIAFRYLFFPITTSLVYVSSCLKGLAFICIHLVVACFITTFGEIYEKLWVISICRWFFPFSILPVSIYSATFKLTTLISLRALILAHRQYIILIIIGILTFASILSLMILKDTDTLVRVNSYKLSNPNCLPDIFTVFMQTIIIPQKTNGFFWCIPLCFYAGFKVVYDSNMETDVINKTYQSGMEEMIACVSERLILIFLAIISSDYLAFRTAYTFLWEALKNFFGSWITSLTCTARSIPIRHSCLDYSEDSNTEPYTSSSGTTNWNHLNSQPHHSTYNKLLSVEDIDNINSYFLSGSIKLLSLLLLSQNIAYFIHLGKHFLLFSFLAENIIYKIASHCASVLLYSWGYWLIGYYCKNNMYAAMCYASILSITVGSGTLTGWCLIYFFQLNIKHLFYLCWMLHIVSIIFSFQGVRMSLQPPIVSVLSYPIPYLRKARNTVSVMWERHPTQTNHVHYDYTNKTTTRLSMEDTDYCYSQSTQPLILHRETPNDSLNKIKQAPLLFYGKTLPIKKDKPLRLVLKGTRYVTLNKSTNEFSLDGIHNNFFCLFHTPSSKINHCKYS